MEVRLVRKRVGDVNEDEYNTDGDDDEDNTLDENGVGGREEEERRCG